MVVRVGDSWPRENGFRIKGIKVNHLIVVEIELKVQDVATSYNRISIYTIAESQEHKKMWEAIRLVTKI